MSADIEDQEWSVDDFLAECDRVNGNPPPAPPGLELVECAAEPRHWPTYVAHIDGMYPAPCMYCISASQADEISRLRHQSHRARLWKTGAYKWLARHGYTLGLTSGSSWGNGCSLCGVTTRIYWRGKRSYILGRRPEWWTCVLRRRHFPAIIPDLGMCAICLPCPDCGSADPLHRVCGGAA